MFYRAINDAFVDKSDSDDISKNMSALFFNINEPWHKISNNVAF